MKINYKVKKTIITAYNKVIEEIKSKEIVLSFESEAQLAEFLVDNEEFLLNEEGDKYEDYYAEKICKTMDDTSDGIYLRFSPVYTKANTWLQQKGFNFTKVMYLKRGIPIIPLKDFI